MADNTLLIALALTERVEPQIKTCKRDQISRSTLASIQRCLVEAMAKITASGVDSDLYNYYFLDVIDLIDALLEDDTFEVTDTETKNMISEKVNAGLEHLYLQVGEFYDTEHEFNYSKGLDNLLQRVVDKCIQGKYYFGYKLSDLR